MYHFTKVRSELEGEHIFKNEMFCKDGEENLRSIRRREIVNNGGSKINCQSNRIVSLAHAINNGQAYQIHENKDKSVVELDVVDSQS